MWILSVSECVRMCVCENVKSYRINVNEWRLNRQRDTLNTHRGGMRDSRLRTWIPNFPYRLRRLFFFSFSLSLSASASACKYQYVSVYLCVIFIPFNMFFCVFFFFFFFFSLSFVWVISAGFVVEYVHWYATSGMCFCCVLAQLIGWMSEWASKYTFPCANHAFIVYTLISVFLFFCLLSLNRTISC